MCLEQEVGRDRCLHLVGREIGVAWLRMWPDIGVRPAVEAAFLHPDQVVRGQIVAEPITERRSLVGISVADCRSCSHTRR